MNFCIVNDLFYEEDGQQSCQVNTLKAYPKTNNFRKRLLINSTLDERITSESTKNC